jgi:hypothetical protein
VTQFSILLLYSNVRLNGMAEGVGFEPTVPCGTPVFKTGGFNRSPTPPVMFSSTYVGWIFLKVILSTIRVAIFQTKRRRNVARF